MRSIGCENCLDPSPVSLFSQVRLHCSPLGRDGGWVSRLGLLLLVASIGAAITVNELVGKPVPFLRWSFLTMMLRGRHLLREWQVGDGRETALEKYVVASTRPGDVDDAIRVIDHFCRHVSYLINVGDQPAYRAHMRDNDGTLWHTTEHRTHPEYQSVIKDIVLESDYLGT
jgi:hypothetical protein